MIPFNVLCQSTRPGILQIVFDLKGISLLKGSAQYLQIHHCKEHGVIVYHRIQFNGNPEHD